MQLTPGMNDLTYWTDLVIHAIVKQGNAKKTAIYLITQMDEFKQSGISAAELEDSVNKALAKQS